MGKQQLLLIALGVFVVGAAIVVSINLFSVSFSDQVKDLALLKVHDIGMRANIYRKKSTESGGGGGSYKGFKKNSSAFLKSDEIVKKLVFSERKQRIIMTFTLITKGENKRPYKIKAWYNPDGIEKLRAYDPDRRKWVWLIKEKKEKKE